MNLLRRIPIFIGVFILSMASLARAPHGFSHPKYKTPHKERHSFQRGLASQDNETLYRQRAAHIDRKLREARFSGSIYLKCGGKVYLNKSYGRRARELQGKYYDIGSITKQFTAAAIMKLAENGKLSLNDPISNWIKPLPPEKGKITIEELVTHRSGLVYPKDSDDEPDRDDYPDIKKQLSQYKPGYQIKDLKASSLEEINTMDLKDKAFSYNNSNYTTLAYIVTQASKQSFNRYLKYNVLKPLGVPCGFNDHRSIAKDRAAMGHSKGRNTTLAGYFMDGPGFIGATGLICRPQDLAKWYESMGNLYKDPKTFDRVRYLEGSPLKSGNKGYSYGLQFDKPLIQHTGSTVGFVSASAYNPATGCVGVSFSDEETDFSTQPSVDTWLGIEQDYGDDEEPPPESSP